MTRRGSVDPVRFRRGDRELMGRLVREHTGSVLRWVRRYAETPQDAEDLVQEVWLRVLERRGSYGGEGSFRGWLHRVARSVGVDRIRKRESRRRTHDGASREVGGPSPVGTTPGGADDPDVRLDHLRRLERVRRAVDELPPRQRETLALRLLDGLTTRETARVMECAEGTVKAALSRALENVRSALGVDAPDGPPRRGETTESPKGTIP